MDKKLLIYFIIVIIIFIITILIIIIFSYINLYHPGLFLSLDNLHDWMSEDINKPLLLRREVDIIKSKIDNECNVKWKNSALGVIGTAAYIDTSYVDDVVDTNKYLLEKYGHELYEKIRIHLEDRLKLKCVYPSLKYEKYNKIGLPGFHVFNGNSLLGKRWNVASLHIDNQEKKIKWPKLDFDWSKTYSFTIPITTPPGTGLYIFNYKSDEPISYSLAWWKNINRSQKQFIKYKKGECYLHHGKWYHMIGGFDGSKEDRITIQGHCIFCRTYNEYWLYW